MTDTTGSQPDPQLQEALDKSKAKAATPISKVTLALGAAVILIAGFLGGYALKGATTDSNQGPGGNFRRGGYGMMGGYGMPGGGEGGPGGGQMPSGNPPSGAPSGA